METVDLLPHVGGNDFPDRSGVLPGGHEAGQDRIGICGIGGEELDHGLLRRLSVPVREILMIARGRHQRFPLLRRSSGQIEREIQIDLDESGIVLRPFNIAVQPIDGTRDSAQHC